jgi:enoyl-CoA hydratase/carnithine racemase
LIEPSGKRLAESPALPQQQPPSLESNTMSDVMDVLTSEQIKVWISDQIAVVTLNRPENRNAMTHAMWRAVPTIFAALDRNPEVRAVILTGAGRDFSAGADISEFEKVRDDTAQATAYEVAVDACCDAIANISKPTIAVVRGYCLGGGAHLAMSCDFRYAAADAVFGIPAARLSIIYGVRGTRKLLSLVGLAQAKRILFGAQRFDAAQALRTGFVDHVAGDTPATPSSRWSRLWSRARSAATADPMAAARDFAKSLAGNAPLSMAGAKALLNGMAMGAGALDLQHAEALIAAAAGSADYREGRAAFAEKRAPRFQGH